MSTVKKFAKYAIWLILFWVLSDLLIYLGLNSTYKKMENINEISNQITVKEAEATKVNGRIKGTITNKEENNISGKYLKVDLYADSGNILATEYISIGDLEINGERDFESYFKMQDVRKYDITIVDEKAEENSTNIFKQEDMTKFGVLLLLTYMIFF